MRDPFVAVDTATDLRSHARALRRRWDAGVGGGVAGGGVRPLIEASWRRTEAAGIDPDHATPTQAFAPDELDDQRAASPLTACIDVLRSCLGGFAQDAEHVMVVVDAGCRILWLEGDTRTRLRADRIAFAEGMLWTEDSVGTNAIGTALAIDHAVQVFSAEHYAAKQHPWWCSAAPIHDPLTGELLGVVDISGPMHTAHPHSLALVSAAASMAQERLRIRHTLADERLRRAYLERTLGAPRAARGLVSADGRLLEGDLPLPAERARGAGAADARSARRDRPDPAWPSRLDLPAGGGPVTLPDGTTAVAEPLDGGRGHVLWHAGTGASAPASVRLQLLGTATPTVRVGRAEPIPLGTRHAELLGLLALHPEGLASDALLRLLYGDAPVTPVTLRAEVSRLRALLPGLVGSRPYRLKAAVAADVLDVERALRRGTLADALAAHTGPLLPASTAPGIVRARDELEASVRRVALGADLDDLWRWLQAPAGRHDADALARFVRRCGPADARRAIAAARLRGLQLS